MSAGVPIERSGEQFATHDGIDLCYETFVPRKRKVPTDSTPPTVLLIMGLGGPMTWWDNEFCTRLAMRGFRVIRYDNRDTGRSTKLRQHRVTRSTLFRGFLGRAESPYTLSDLADDAVAILDAVGAKSAHVVGVSMGGMIAQTLALAYPERVLSLTSIMSTTGRRTVGWQHPRLIPTLLGSAGSTRHSYAEKAAKSWRRIGSPDYPIDRQKLIERAFETYDRGWSASGVLRHMAAVNAQPDRTAELAKLDIPTTVIHGLRDPLVHRSGGRATARAIADAELLEIAGMGHDLPSQLYGTIIDAIVRTTERADHL